MKVGGNGFGFDYFFLILFFKGRKFVNIIRLDFYYRGLWFV